MYQLLVRLHARRASVLHSFLGFTRQLALLRSAHEN